MHIFQHGTINKHESVNRAKIMVHGIGLADGCAAMPINQKPVREILLIKIDFNKVISEGNGDCGSGACVCVCGLGGCGGGRYFAVIICITI